VQGAVAVVTVFCLLAPGAARAQDDDAPSSDGSAFEEYQHTLAEEQQIRDAQKAAQQRADDLGRQIADLDAHLAELQGELDGAQAELDARQADYDRTNASLLDVQARLATEQQRLRNQAIQAYVGGGATPVPDFVAALKDATAIEDLAKSQVYAEAVVVDRKAVIQRVGELREQADDLRSRADEILQTAQAARDEVAGRKDELEQARAQQADAQAAALDAAAEQQRLGEEIETRRRADELAYAEQVSQSDSITQMLARWEKDQIPRTDTYGIFLNPIKNGKIVSGYGPRLHPIYNVVRQHNGLDLDGDMGEPMRASENGLVLIASEQGGYGNTVVIDHGGQLATLYGHMSEIDVKPGDIVQRGQRIGLVGSTGVSTGPHCHWEVRVLGLPVDGTPYLDATPEP
jgi:murein DD-endopeptidase MepM/ murein hydrolase activator NlpD